MGAVGLSVDLASVEALRAPEFMMLLIMFALSELMLPVNSLRFMNPDRKLRFIMLTRSWFVCSWFADPAEAVVLVAVVLVALVDC